MSTLRLNFLIPFTVLSDSSTVTRKCELCSVTLEVIYQGTRRHVAEESSRL